MESVFDYKHIWGSFAIALVAILLFSFDIGMSDDNPIYSEDINVWDAPFFPDGTYDESIPEPKDVIGPTFGEDPVRYCQMVEYLEKLADSSPLVILKEHGQTYEGRKLYHLIISSGENLSRLDDIKANLARLADPRKISGRNEAIRLAETTPTVAWMAYTIHGDEVSGTDAALQLAYQLAAGTDDHTRIIRENVVTLIDPLENPDGRERYLSMLQWFDSKTPNYDARSLQHEGVWPAGRTNHYLFDMNRDYILLTQPETRGRVATILEWNPQLVVDAHEMWPDATFLFSPPRQPINYHTPANVMKWYKVFHDDQAAAFDRYGWSYYSGDWNDQWYPGYGSAWPTYLGAVGILYEQAGIGGEKVFQSDEYVLSFYECIHHQFTSSMANLRTSAGNRKELLLDYYKTRRDAIEQGRKDGLKFLFVPGKDIEKYNSFIETLLLQGIEVELATRSFKAGDLHGVYHDRIRGRTLPAGTHIVSAAQPLGALVRAILEFDPHMKKDMLERERRHLERNEGSLMYEVMAWSLPLAYNMEAYWTMDRIKVPTKKVEQISEPEASFDNPNPKYGYLINNTGEKTSRVLVELFKKELNVYIGVKPFTADGVRYERGSLLIRKLDNPDNLGDILKKISGEFNVEIRGVNSAYTEDGPDLGSTKFDLLKEPVVAFFTDSPMEWGSTGSLWHLIDVELGLPHSLINFESLHWSDLSKYNVIVLPSIWGGAGTAKNAIGEHGISKLKKWMSDGGTLICVANSSEFAADSSVGLSQVKLLCQALDKVPMYEKMVEMEKEADKPKVDTMAIWHPEEVKKEDEDKMKPPEKPGDIEYLKKIDQLNRKFHPQGPIVRVNLDNEKWLAFGMEDKIPAFLYNNHALLSARPVTTVGRFADAGSLRLSGLLWPEARRRWAETAYITQERMGGGQIIMFADDPYQRAYFHSTRQLFVNALLLGPGMLNR
jgi:hypothetical protein